MAKKKGTFTGKGKEIFRPSNMDDLLSDEPKPSESRSSKTKLVKTEQPSKESVRRLNIQISEELYLWMLDEINERQRDSDMKGRRSQRAVVEEGLTLLKRKSK